MEEKKKVVKVKVVKSAVVDDTKKSASIINSEKLKKQILEKSKQKKLPDSDDTLQKESYDSKVSSGRSVTDIMNELRAQSEQSPNPEIKSVPSTAPKERKERTTNTFFANVRNWSLKKKLLAFALCIPILYFMGTMVYSLTYGIHTEDKYDGWVHQTGNFPKNCTYCEYDDKTTPATHHIKHSDYYFCDECWASSGEDLYNRLAYGSSNNSNSYSDYSDDYSDDYSSDYSSGGYSSGNEIDAKVCAEKFVRDNLKSPSTASMCSFSEMNATNTGGNQWNITGYVDAQNSFGATIRSHWIVTLTLTSSGFTDASVVFVD